MEMSEDMRNQHSDASQGERVSNDMVDFGREACESVDSDGVDDSLPGEMSSSEEDERVNHTHTKCFME